MKYMKYINNNKIYETYKLNKIYEINTKLYSHTKIN